MTKKRLADETGLTSRSVSYYEAGEREPEPETLEALASALDFPVKFFQGDDPPFITGEGASFRALSRMTASQRDAALAAGSLAIRLSDWIEERFALPSADVPDSHENSDPEGAATEVRAAWGLGERPIKNIVHLLESRGVRVFSLAEDHDEVDAYSLWRGTTPFVFLNTRKSAERSRFDAAHELGHLVLHRHGVPRGRKTEDDANAFAAAFLMPHAGVLARAPLNTSLRGILDGKLFWGVSAMAYAYRLHKVGMLSDWHYHRLMKKMAVRGYRRREPAPLPRETSQLLWKVFDRLRQERLPKTMIARELAIEIDDLECLVFGLVLTTIEGGAAGGGVSRIQHLRLVKP